jgi:hypothetical protein
MVIDTSTEVQALEAEMAKLARLYARGTEAEARIKTLRAKHGTLEEQLGATAVSDDAKRVAAIRRELREVREEITDLEVGELALRKASAEQHARVSALREPVERMRVEVAFRGWLEFLPQLEAALTEAAPVHGIAGTLGFGGPRLRDAFTGQPLAWCPDSSEVENWRVRTDELKTRLRKAGYAV